MVGFFHPFFATAQAAEGISDKDVFSIEILKDLLRQAGFDLLHQGKRLHQEGELYRLAGDGKREIQDRCLAINPI